MIFEGDIWQTLMRVTPILRSEFPLESKLFLGLPEGNYPYVRMVKDANTGEYTPGIFFLGPKLAWQKPISAETRILPKAGGRTC